MKRTKLALLAALLCAGTAAPALADWDNIGSITVTFGHDQDQRSFNLGGRVERLQLMASHGDVACRSVRADFGNGQSGDIFHGALPQGRPVTVDVPGQSQSLRGLFFQCTTLNRQPATVRISADVGRYRDEWRRNPDWQRTWSHMFNWSNAPANGGGMAYNGNRGGSMGYNGPNPDNDWQMIGNESFEGRNDRDSSFAGWQGRRVSAVALKPLETDARCSRAVAQFGDGRSQPLNVNNGDLMRQGRIYKLDLPGDSRNLERLTMRCSAIDARRVTIQIFVNK